MNAQLNSLPAHQIRYVRAWLLHQDESCSEQSRKVLEKEMDSAQEYFTWEEFQQFKATLPRYVEYWSELKQTLLQLLNEL